MEEERTSKWIRIKNQFPRCQECGYYWIETVIGPIGEGKSNIVDARYCPYCGTKMNGVITKK